MAMRIAEACAGVGVLLVLAMPSVSTASDDLIALQNTKVPRLTCRDDAPTRELNLGRNLVEKRLESGQLHAAYAEVMSLPAERADVALLRADILRRLGRTEAVSWYQGLLKTCKAAPAWHGLGQIAAASGDWSLAVQRFQQAVVQLPASPRFRNDLGYGLLRTGRLREAEFELRAALELEPDNRLAGLNLLLTYMMLSDAPRSEAQILRWQPTRQEFDDLLSDCARYSSSHGSADASCPLRL